MVVLGWIAVVLSTSLSLPQVVAALRVGGRAQISLWPWVAVSGSAITWVIYGMTFGNYPLVVSNVLSFTASGVIVLLVGIREHGQRAWMYFGALVGLAVALYSLLAFPILFAIASAMPSCIGWLAQAARLVRDRRPLGFAIGSVWLTVLSQSCWLIYGFSVHDIPLAISTQPILSAALLVAVLYSVPRRTVIV